VVVRRNLKHAFLALRKHSLLRPGRAVWLDALCINQGDFGWEKQLMVVIMPWTLSTLSPMFGTSLVIRQ
jgi:hypothetical protein